MSLNELLKNFDYPIKLCKIFSILPIFTNPVAKFTLIKTRDISTVISC